LDIPAGTRLGRYEISSLLGKGGMGEVYLAYDTSLRRQVAIKLLPAGVTQDKGRLSRFKREAHAASGLNHPNILTIYEIGRQDEQHFIATEYIEGESLRELMTRKSIDLREVLDVTSQVASALSAAHQAGIVHRDIKPENIMLRRDGFVKVLDFGLAKSADETDSVKQGVVDREALTQTALVNTEPGVVMGTVSYMSPEQARGMQVDARTDIWSLGVVLYEMIAKRLPFDGPTSSDKIAAILKTEPPLLKQYAPEIPAELERIVSKALEKNPEARYQGIKDFALDLRSLKQRLEFEAELERTSSRERRISDASPGKSDSFAVTIQTAAVQTEPGREIGGTSSNVLEGIKRNKRAALIVMALLVAIGAGTFLAYSRYFAQTGRKNIRSIAVLPFVNASNNPDAEYLSDGVSESLINNLSQLPGVKVIARSSSFRYKGKDVEPQEIGRALGVAAILTGRVAQLGDDLIIQADLVDTSDGSQIWGAQYKRKLVDILNVQQNIATQISDRLRIELTPDEHKRATKTYTENTEAYQLYLRGRFYWNQRSPEGLKKALDYFRQATDKDPLYAPAYSGMADVYLTLFDYDLLSFEETSANARAAAAKALQIDDQLAEAHNSIAHLNLHDWKWDEAEAEFKRAIDLDKGYASAYHWYSLCLTAMGRSEEAVTTMRKAQELDPLSLRINGDLGMAMFAARQYPEAIEQERKTLELDPNFRGAYWIRGMAYEQQGLLTEAIQQFEEALKRSPGNPNYLAAIGHAYGVAGKRTEALRVLDEMHKKAEQGPVSPFFFALVYAGLNDKESALQWLQKAYEQRSGSIRYLKMEPRLDNIRSDPRFVDLMRRVGLAS
jgi:serine/threonine protein kinase/Tfp pilus assembly protein PilF